LSREVTDLRARSGEEQKREKKSSSPYN